MAPNIYYLGYAGVVQFNGVRIGGISGIFKDRDYFRGHFESAPYDENSKRSVYHQRQLEVFRLSQLTPGLDVCLSHDWPRGITQFGNVRQLIKFKPFFAEDIENNTLGSRPCEDLLHKLQPKYWFSAHLHCKFSAIVSHEDGQQTKFLALDKCLPKRRFLQILDIAQPEAATEGLLYDLEWLTVLSLTNHLLSVKYTTNYMPGPNGTERFDFRPTDEEKSAVAAKFGGDLKIPENFTLGSPAFDPAQNRRYGNQPDAQINVQTTQFCERLAIDDPLSLVLLLAGKELNYSTSTMNDSDLTYNVSLNSTCGDTKEAPLASTLPRPKWVENPDQICLDESDDELLSDEKLVEKFEAKYSTPFKVTTTPRSKLVLPSPKLEEQQPIDLSAPSTPVESPAAKKFKRRNQEIYEKTE